MVLCVVYKEGGQEVVEFLNASAGNKAGDRISAEGCSQCEKQDVWRKLSPIIMVKNSRGDRKNLTLVDSAGNECTSSREIDGTLL
jgi:hypothetical protein